MRTLEKLPDLSRTKAALEAYDRANDGLLLKAGSDSEATLAELRRIEDLGRAVGHAFGLDTQDRNNVETCAQVIRPGPRVPAPGYEPSFVRRMVANWEAAQK